MTSPAQNTSPLREALEQITALAEQQLSPPVTTFGHRDPWVNIGKRAVQIAREALTTTEETGSG